MTNLNSILKSRDITLSTKVHLVKAMVFPVVMYGCESWTIKKAESWRIDAFELWCWSQLFSLLDCKDMQPVHPKGDQSWVFIEGLMLKLKFQYFGHLMRRADLFEKILMLRKIEWRRRSGWQRVKWLVASLTQWTWVWTDSGTWWWTGRPCMRRFIGSQGVEHYWVTELNWTQVSHFGELSRVFCSIQ